MTSDARATGTSPDTTVAADVCNTDAGDAVFVNPTRYVWFYFKVPNLRDEGPTLVELQSWFHRRLADFQSQCSTNTTATLNLPTGTCSESRRIYLSPRQPWGTRNIELELRHLQDVYVLLINVEAPGRFNPANLPELTELKFGPQQVSNFLGSFTVVQAETDGDLTDAAQTLHAHYLNPGVATGRAFPAIDTGHAVLLPGPPGHIGDLPMAGAVFVYAEQSDADRIAGPDGSRLSAAEEQLMKHMPSIGLCHLKAVNSRRRLRDDLSPAVQNTDYDLQQLLSGSLPDRTSATATERRSRERISRVLKPGNPTCLSLQDLRSVSDELTTLRSRLTDNTEHVRREVHTVSINRSNLAATTQSWPAGADRIAQALYDQVVNDAVLQATSDRDYAESTLRRADIYFESIEASARCHEVQETRWVAHIMIGLGAFAAADLVPALVGGATFEGFDRGTRLMIEAGVFLITGSLATGLLMWQRSKRLN